ncbi:uncharacterized protein PHACADRAFT_251110 [Phanerochaete carnosa HHB-10118-sp]|uniref:Uncharacterized protein n=1 Tax=Phanerochaete carnosa (strain HHB-10118-sp) TaxID=650164 RepID=K5X3R3_PHACS|nr:uncharacterized protein PHACADRAFT_251110 [Phanerochaete carnosa HHB-10118-sp]EKM57447.1 hypothetical protein PHACADRAFT_251110 [Phanerochaete carnosa HHB-10118-sp]
MTLTERYGTLYRQLLHTLEKAYKLDKLRGDQNSIWHHLHVALKTSYNEYGSTCEVDGCHWIGHIKNRQDEGGDYVECNLLSKRIRPASAVDAHGKEQLAEPLLSSLFGPQPSSPSGLVTSSDPPQGLAHAELHGTMSHESSLTSAVNVPEYQSSRPLWSTAKHKARRHALGRVVVARSMDELTRLEAARVEQGRRRSWG